MLYGPPERLPVVDCRRSVQADLGRLADACATLAARFRNEALDATEARDEFLKTWHPPNGHQTVWRGEDPAALEAAIASATRARDSKAAALQSVVDRSEMVASALIRKAEAARSGYYLSTKVDKLDPSLDNACIDLKVLMMRRGQYEEEADQAVPDQNEGVGLSRQRSCFDARGSARGLGGSEPTTRGRDARLRPEGGPRKLADPGRCAGAGNRQAAADPIAARRLGSCGCLCSESFGCDGPGEPDRRCDRDQGQEHSELRHKLADLESRMKGITYGP